MENIKHQFLSGSRENASVATEKNPASQVWLIPYEQESTLDVLFEIARKLNSDSDCLQMKIENFHEAYCKLDRDEIPQHEKTVKNLTNELTDFIISASGKYNIPTKKMVSIASGSGATCISSIIMLNPGLVNYAILIDPLLPFIPRPLPDLSGVHLLIISSIKEKVKQEDVKTLSKTFISSNAEVEIVLNLETQSPEKQIEVCKNWLNKIHF
jgi:predicted esterase